MPWQSNRTVREPWVWPREVCPSTRDQAVALGQDQRSPATIQEFWRILFRRLVSESCPSCSDHSAVSGPHAILCMSSVQETGVLQATAIDLRNSSPFIVTLL